MPVRTSGEGDVPTPEQKAYFDRQMAKFVERLAYSIESRTQIECDSLVARDCLEMAARSMNRRDQLLLGFFGPDYCATLGDQEQLMCLNWIIIRREAGLREWEKEWRQHKSGYR